MSQTITALFDNRPEAEAAMERVAGLGVPRTSIRLSPETQSNYKSSDTAYDYRRDEGGFWSSLKDIFMPEEDRYSYAEGMSRGGTMVIVDADPSQAHQVADVLENAGAVHLEDREATWRQEGWSGYSAASTSSSASTGVSAAAGSAPTTGTAAGLTGEQPAARSTDTAGAMASPGAMAGRDETIPVAEEQLRVGKRVAEAGRVRVRSYVVETPVQEQVTLRDERVQVERRPVDRAPTAADERLFAERTIEATERAEEAVVSKDVRVTEEIGLRREATQHTETISDKVRRTEVEVEDERGNVTRTGVTGTTDAAPKR